MEFDKPQETKQDNEVEIEEDNKKINISVLQCCKLYNAFTTFIINLNSLDTILKK